MITGTTKKYRYFMRLVYAHHPIAVNIVSGGKVLEIKNFSSKSDDEVFEAVVDKMDRGGVVEETGVFTTSETEEGDPYSIAGEHPILRRPSTVG